MGTADRLRCSLNEQFFLTVTFDDKFEQEDRLRIRLKLFSTDNEEDVLAEKIFSWPETKLPIKVEYMTDDRIVQLTGQDNIAKIAVNLDSMLLGRLKSRRQPAEPCQVYTSIRKQRELLPTDPVTTTVMSIINDEDVERCWKELVELVSASGNVKLPEQLINSVYASWRQEALLECICAHIGKDGSAKAVLLTFVQQRLFTATNACMTIVKLAQRENWLDIVLDLVRYALSIDESVYALCLKMAVNRIGNSGGTELLVALLNHRVTPDKLVEQLADNLSANEAAILINHLVELLDVHQIDDTSYRNIVELLTLLVNGCAQQMLWDKECHDDIRKAAHCISEQVQLTDTISTFTYHLSGDALRLNLESEVQESDYVIESIPYQCKSL